MVRQKDGHKFTCLSIILRYIFCPIFNEVELPTLTLCSPLAGTVDPMQTTQSELVGRLNKINVCVCVSLGLFFYK